MDIPPIPPDDFKTSDLGLAAFLLTLQFPLLQITFEGSRASFVFPGTAHGEAKLFWQPGRNAVDARAFHSNLRELRRLARGGRR